jgi:SAM-dependent methyltransferase
VTGLLERWDRQQAAYIADREGRFAAMLDVIDLQADGAPGVVLDLACGPGSLSFRVLDRFPQARVIGLDHDPALLALAREAGERYAGRATFLDDDLTDPGWVDRVRGHLGDGAGVSAVVSTTALHWLSPAQLVETYRAAHASLTSGGVFVDGDHFRFDDRQTRARSWAEAHDRRTQDAAFAAGADPWDDWWSDLRARDGYAELVAERDRRFADRPAPEPTTVGFRLAALLQAGFVEHGTVWQLFDDYVVYGVA